MDNEQTRKLHEAPIRRLLFNFSIPIIVGMIVNGTYNIVARIFVGQYFDENGLAALTVSFPIMLIVLAFGMMIGHGSAALVSIRLGEKRKEDAEKIIGQALFLFLVLSALFSTLGIIFMEPMLRFFGADDVVLPYAKEYLRPIILGVLFQKISFGMNGLLSSEGRPKIAMMTMLIAALLNIGFDFLFIVWLRTGIWGAGVSTVLAQIISAGWITAYYLSGRTMLKWRFEYIKFDVRLAWAIAKIGSPSFVMQAVSCFIQGVQNRQLKYYGYLYGLENGFENGGNIAIAVMGVLFATGMLFVFPILGIARGMQPIIGYNTGAKQYRRVERTLVLGLAISVLFGVCVMIPAYIEAEWIVACFIDKEVNPEFIAIGAYALRIFVSMMPAVSVVIVSASYFQASGYAAVALILTLLRQVGFLIPLMLILPYYFGLNGIWMSHPISDAAACFCCLIALGQAYRRSRILPN